MGSAKRAGLEALVELSPTGGLRDRSIQLAFRCFVNPSDMVRETAIETITALAPRGHQPAILAAKIFARGKIARGNAAKLREAGIAVLGEVAWADTPEVMGIIQENATT